MPKPNKARLPIYTAPTKTGESNNIEDIRARWEAKAAQDRLGAALQKEEDLKAVKLFHGYTFPESWDSPPLVCPKEILEKQQNVNPDNVNAVNAVLIKSWETQASSCPSLRPIERRSPTDDFLIQLNGFKISGYLKYYLNR